MFRVSAGACDARSPERAKTLKAMVFILFGKFVNDPLAPGGGRAGAHQFALRLLTYFVSSRGDVNNLSTFLHPFDFGRENRSSK